MKNNMQACIRDSLSLNSKCALLIATVLLLGSCEGGIVGTGGGPKDTTVYELSVLPERISPDIPKHLQTVPSESEGDSPDQLMQHSGTSLLRDSLEPKLRADSWQELNFQLSILAILRLEAEHSMTLADVAISDVVSRCELQTVCLIPANEIQVQYTQPVINRLIKLYTDTLGFSETDSQGQNEYLESVVVELSQLTGTEVALGETTYTRLGGNPYDYIISTSLTQLDVHREFTIQWRDDGSVTDFVSRHKIEEDDSYELSYFYQAGSPGESVIAKVESSSQGQTASLNIKLIGNDPENAGILIEAHSVSLGAGLSSDSVSGSASTPSGTQSSSGEVAQAGDAGGVSENTDSVVSQNESDGLPTVAQDPYTFRSVLTIEGQISNDGGYAAVEEYEIPDESPESIDYLRLFRETFDGDGYLLAGETCLEYSAFNRCDTDTAFTMYGPGNAALVDSALYYPDGSFTVLESNQDAIRWEVVDLPSDIREFAVVAADTGTSLIDRAYLCLGYQDNPGNIQLFCGATDEQLSSSTEIINITVTEMVSPIPAARLIQAD